MRIYIALCEDLKPFTKTRYANPRYANSRCARKPCTGQDICTGIFNDHSELMKSEISKYHVPRPYGPIFWLLWFTIIILMGAIQIERQKDNNDEIESPTHSIVQRPEDLESIMLNFALLILLAINLLGYYFYWQK